jgi:hypothetical protein
MALNQLCYEVWYCESWDPTWCWWDYYCTYEQQCWTTTEKDGRERESIEEEQTQSRNKGPNRAIDRRKLLAKGCEC